MSKTCCVVVLATFFCKFHYYHYYLFIYLHCSVLALFPPLALFELPISLPFPRFLLSAFLTLIIFFFPPIFHCFNRNPNPSRPHPISRSPQKSRVSSPNPAAGSDRRFHRNVRRPGSWEPVRAADRAHREAGEAPQAAPVGEATFRGAARVPSVLGG